MNVLENASKEEILKFKLACKSEEITNDQIENLFLNLVIEDEKEIEEIINILLQYRKEVYNKFIE